MVLPSGSRWRRGRRGRTWHGRESPSSSDEHPDVAPVGRGDSRARCDGRRGKTLARGSCVAQRWPRGTAPVRSTNTQGPAAPRGCRRRSRSRATANCAMPVPRERDAGRDLDRRPVPACPGRTVRGDGAVPPGRRAVRRHDPRCLYRPLDEGSQRPRSADRAATPGRSSAARGPHDERAPAVIAAPAASGATGFSRARRNQRVAAQ